MDLLQLLDRAAACLPRQVLVELLDGVRVQFQRRTWLVVVEKRLDVRRLRLVEPRRRAGKSLVACLRLAAVGNAGLREA